MRLNKPGRFSNVSKESNYSGSASGSAEKSRSRSSPEEPRQRREAAKKKKKVYDEFADPLDYDSEDEEESQYQLSHSRKQKKSLLQKAQPLHIDFLNDYEPLRLGIKTEPMIIVLEYFIPSSDRRFHHYIHIGAYMSSSDLHMSISQSKSGSFKDQLRFEVR